MRITNEFKHRALKRHVSLSLNLKLHPHKLALDRIEVVIVSHIQIENAFLFIVLVEVVKSAQSQCLFLLWYFS